MYLYSLTIFYFGLISIIEQGKHSVAL